MNKIAKTCMAVHTHTHIYICNSIKENKKNEYINKRYMELSRKLGLVCLFVLLFAFGLDDSMKDKFIA